MTESGAFEPTQPQTGVDDNMFILIDPETIPYPLTDIWSLNYAAETLRTGGENLADEAEDMRATWLTLQAHYSAPETGTLFPKMNPVASRGESIESDLRTVAGALEDLTEAVRTARRSLNSLRLQAQSFRNRHEDKKVWWLTKDDETDEWALLENKRIKDEVNAAWSTFNEAENDCATRISSLIGGPAYSSPDQAGGTDVIYGLPTDAGEDELPTLRENFLDPLNDMTEWARIEYHPSQADFKSSKMQSVWDTVVTNELWPMAVGAVSWTGTWHPDTGWQWSLPGRLKNIGLTARDEVMDTADMIGVHDQHGWLWQTPKDGQGGEGSVWDRWGDNLENTKDEMWEAYTAWSKRDEDPEYSNFTIGANAVMMTAGLPLKLIKGLLSSSSGGSTGPTPSDGHSPGSDGPSSGRGPGTGEWPTSPLPNDRPGSGTPTTERFSGQLTHLRDSLLDPHQHRGNPSSQPGGPSPGPDRPTSTDRGDRPSSDPTTPHRGDSSTQDNRTPPTRPRDGDSQHGNGHDNHSGTRSDRENSPSTSPTRSDNGSQRDHSDGSRSDRSPAQHPQGHHDDNSSGDQNNNRTGRGDDHQGGTRPREDQGQPEPATGGGRGDDGGNQPPNDRTGTGDENSGDSNDKPNDPEERDPQDSPINKPEVDPSKIIPGGGLSANEAAGGHAISRHVGVSTQYLEDRTLGNIPGAPSGRIAGSYPDLEKAEHATATVLSKSSTEITSWLQEDMSVRTNRRKLLKDVEVDIEDLRYAGKRLGSMVNPTGWEYPKATHVTVMLVHDPSLPPQNFRIHTSYPTPTPPSP